VCGTPQLEARPRCHVIVLAEKTDMVPLLLQAESELATEYGNPAPKAGECRRPDVEFQRTDRVIDAVPRPEKATGLGQRVHAQRQPYAAMRADAAPPSISTIEPFGCIKATAGR